MTQTLVVTFAGSTGGTGVAAPGAKAGDRIASIARLDTPGSPVGFFGEFIPADNIVFQIAAGDLTGQSFVATLERQA